jgi:cytochrome c oxidase subunit 2
VAMGCLMLSVSLAGPLFFPEQASSFAGEVDSLYTFLTVVTVTISVAVAFLLIYFAAKYRRRPGWQVGVPQRRTTPHEVTWISVLLVIALIMFGWGARVFLRQYTPPKDDLVIYVIGKQWMWKFQHPGGQMEINELHVPVGRDVKLILVTRDVIHSLYVPAFRVKMDAVPGRYRTFWFRATKTGRYHLFCTEYCGTNHSGMTGWVTVMEPAAYAAFLSTGRMTRSLAWEGEKLFLDLACQSCHRGDTQGRGPRLDGVYGKPVLLRDGSSLIADDNYLRESIVNPAAQIVTGFEPIMPTFQGQLSEEQLLALLAYIKSLGTAAAPSAAQPGATQPGGRHLLPTLPANPDAQRSNPVGSTPPRTVPIPPLPGEEQP